MHLFLALALAVGAQAAAGISVERSGDGRLLRAAGLDEATQGADAEGSARAFAARHAQELGLGARHALATEAAPAPGTAGAVRLRRTIDDLPVFNDALHVVVDERRSVRAVRASDVPPVIAGSFAIAGSRAAALALAALGPGARAARDAVVQKGYWAMTSATRAAYQVDQSTEVPAGAWRTIVDATTGDVLFRRNLRHDAIQARVFDLSPVETAPGVACPLVAGSYGLCAATALHDLSNLASSASPSLTGSQVQVFNCLGTQFPTGPGDTAACVQDAPINGGFDFQPDATQADPSDAFAGVMAYYHLDLHTTFLKSLDPSNSAKLTAFPAFVNAFDQGAPYENAHFDGALGGIVLGQGLTADYAYDASVAYHELDHGAVFAWGDFHTGLDASGGVGEPDAVNEGLADALAVAQTGNPELGLYIASREVTPEPFLRDIDNQKTCQGTGALVTQLGATRVVDGLDGEPHDDGEVWSGFYWEVSKGLEAAGVTGCGGACDAAATIQFKAVEIAGGGSPTLSSFAADMVQAAGLVFPDRPEVAALVSSVAQRRAMDACDRTFKLFAGERKVQVVQSRYAPFQIAVQVASAPALVQVCSALGSAATVWARKGEKVALTNPSLSGATIATGSTPIGISRPCSTGLDPIGLTSTGTWYLLVDAPGASPSSPDGFLFTLPTVGVAPRFATPAPDAGSPDGGAPAGSGGGAGGCGFSGTGFALLALAPLLLARRRRQERA